MANTSTPPAIDIIYAAHTASCTFLLDSEGICRRIVMAPKGKRSQSRTATRCVGAQYVASLDGSAAGGLVEMPRVGAAMLFARVDERGRVSLVRTSPVVAFESKAAEDPFVESGTVETSAPDYTPRVVSDAAATPRAVPTERSAYREPDVDLDPDYYDDASERTQRIQALRPEDIAAALRDHGAEPSQDLKTTEYRAVSEEPAPRTTLPSKTPTQLPTLRRPHRETTVEGEDDYARAGSASRGMLPRRSDPQLRAAAAVQAWEPDPRPTPPAYGSDVQVSRRRRGG